MKKELRKKVKEWAEECKAKTEAGAMLTWDNEIWPDAKWKIGNEISFTSGEMTIIFDEIEDEENLEDCKKRMKFYREW